MDHTQQQVLAQVDRDAMIELAGALIRIPSFKTEETPVARFLGGFVSSDIGTFGITAVATTYSVSKLAEAATPSGIFRYTCRSNWSVTLASKVSRPMTYLLPPAPRISPS